MSWIQTLISVLVVCLVIWLVGATVCRTICKYLYGIIQELKKNNKNKQVVETNNVNHPKHYSQGNIECIDAMESAFGTQVVLLFCICNAFKYIWRHSKKNGIEDIKKAMWYISKYLELYDKLNNNNTDSGEH